MHKSLTIATVQVVFALKKISLRLPLLDIYARSVTLLQKISLMNDAIFVFSDVKYFFKEKFYGEPKYKLTRY